MKQFFLQTLPDAEGRVIVTGSDYHYLVRVRRHRLDDVLACRNSNGQINSMRIVSLTKTELVLGPCSGICTTDGSVLTMPEPQSNFWEYRFRLVAGISRSHRMDQVVRQAMEFGVYDVWPCQTDFCIRDLGEKAERSKERWERIVREAFQQSGQCNRCTIQLSQTLDSVLHFIENQDRPWIGLYFNEKGDSRISLHAAFSRIHAPCDIICVVGPEGGLSPRENALLDARGFYSVWLGPGVLRTETAVAAALAVVRVIVLEENEWQLRNRDC
jgi:16S rRNA (uracil1498-N3)-methyltransferase